MWAIWFVGGCILVVVGVVLGGGALLPADHIATGSIVVAQTRDAVWAEIRDIGTLPTWRPSVTAVDVLEGPPDAPTRWSERSGSDALRFVLEACEHGRMVRTRIDDDTLPFGGTWTIELSDEAGGTRVRITERGVVKSPPFRFIAKFAIGHSATLRGYLTDLGAKFGGATRIDS